MPSRTGYFGYESASQFDAGAGTLSMHAARLLGGAYGREQSLDPMPGLQGGYQRRLTGGQRWELLGELGLAWVRQAQDESGTRNAEVSVLTDVYQTTPVDLSGRDRHSGSFEPRPGDPRIGDIPSRSIDAGVGTISGRRDLTVDLLPIHLGPTFEYHITRQLHLGLHAGAALIPARADLSYAETVTAPGGASVRHGGSASDWMMLFGWQVQASAAWQWNERWSLQCSGRFIDAGEDSIAARHRAATIDTSGLWSLQLAVTRRF